MIRILSTQIQQCLERYSESLFGVMTKILLNQVWREAIKAGFDRCVRCEKVSRSSDRQGNIERLFMIDHPGARPFQDGERGVTFVEVAHFRLEPQCAKQTPTSDSEDQLLLQPQVWSSAIELAGNAPVHRQVGRIVRIQQIELGSPNLGLPGTHPHSEAGEVDGDSKPLPIWLTNGRDRKLPRVVEWIQSLLTAVGINFLAEIALLIEQSHTDYGHTQVTRGLELVTRNIAQTARIDWQRFTQHEFQAEVRHAVQLRIRMCTLEPRGRF